MNTRWLRGVMLGVALVAAPAVWSAPAEAEMTPEIMQQLTLLARAQEKPGTIRTRIIKILGLPAGTELKTPVQMVRVIKPDVTGKFYFCLPLDRDAKDIFLARKTEAGPLEVYLTDQTLRLRAAAIDTPNEAHLITNEQAAENFAIVVHTLARGILDLPPTKAPN